MVESTWNLVRASRRLWNAAEKLGVVPERVEELARAERRFVELIAEAKRAREHRTREWQPADPKRLAQGLQMARAGEAVKADKAGKRFRRDKSSSWRKKLRLAMSVRAGSVSDGSVSDTITITRM